MILGAQMYTVREYTKNLNDFSETLKKIANIGYKSVQVSGTCPFEAQWLKEELLKNDLACAITHTSPDDILNKTDEVIKNHNIFSTKYIGLGSIPGNLSNGDESYYEFKDKYLPVARKIKQAGKLFMFHNHNKEFLKAKDGVSYLEHMVEDFSENFGITFDTYWAEFAGESATEWLDKLSGKIDCIHLKDLKPVGEEKRMAVVGEGILNYDNIIASCEKGGTKYLLVEQDDTYGENPFDCLKRSYDYLKSMGLK